MSDTAAPFDHATAEAPAEARAVYREAADGVRLRLAHLGHGAAGTILLVPGRTEYLEKYGRAAAAFARRDHGVAALDYRGQGLADRTAPDARLGHVGDFADYQLDMDALVTFARDEDLPRPWHLLGHSLGGAIGLRALTRGLPVASAVFSAPMWDIAISPPLRPLAWGLGWAARQLGAEGWRMPGTGARSYVLTATVADNLLTHDAEMLAYMRRQITTDPRLELAGPSVTWVFRALRECRALRRIGDPGVPTLTILPGEEKIVSSRAIMELTSRWPNARRLDVPGARHEVMMETPERREAFYDAATAFFSEAGSRADLPERVP